MDKNGGAMLENSHPVLREERISFYIICGRKKFDKGYEKKILKN
jgi:hypothetical protein